MIGFVIAHPVLHIAEHILHIVAMAGRALHARRLSSEYVTEGTGTEMVHVGRHPPGTVGEVCVAEQFAEAELDVVVASGRIEIKGRVRLRAEIGLHQVPIGVHGFDGPIRDAPGAFVFHVADNHRHGVDLTGSEGVALFQRDYPAVADRAQHPGRGEASHPWLKIRGARQNFFLCHLAHVFQFIAQFLPLGFRVLQIVKRAEGAGALQDRLVPEAGTQGRGDQQCYGGGPCGDAEYSYPACIAAEGTDVFANPFHRLEGV